VERALADTGALLALFEPRDQYHARARDIADRFVSTGGRFVGTTAILTELSNLLLVRHGPSRTAEGLGVLFADETYGWVDVDLGLVKDSLHAWLERFTDQRFSLTDAISFEVMRRAGIARAFSFDQHFVTAGFSLLD
jgi:hypothetical protein